MKPLLAAMTAAVLLGTSVYAAPDAPDVPSGHWAAAAVHRLAARKIMVGVPSGKFQGNRPVTRYELAVALDRLVRDMEAAHKPLSIGLPAAGIALPAAAPATTKQALAHLAQLGFIPPTSPLLKANGVVTARELSSILSGVVIRLSDRRLPPTIH